MNNDFIIVYVCVDDEKLNYVRQLQLSIQSLLLFNPNFEVYVITDSDTQFTDYISSNSSIIRVNQFDNYSKKMRSRFLKTSLIEYLPDKDFVFLDCDTIICNNIEDIFDGVENVSACIEYNGFSDCTKYANYKLHTSSIYKDIDVNRKHYHNSGVMVYRNNQKIKDFFKLWHSKYKEFRETGGDFVDQPTFYIANLTNDFIINRLDNKYNYMVNSTISSLIPCKDLRIVHYWYESNKWKPINLFNKSDVSKEDIIQITQRFKR